MRDTEKSEDWVLNHVNSLDQSIFDQGETEFRPDDFDQDEQRVNVNSDYLMLFME
ncbi:MAG: hypothetical protein AAFV19_18360 [Pseudomonadota bacterium]